jgi:hypothetical protein
VINCERSAGPTLTAVVTLMIYDGETDTAAALLRTGGVPLVPRGFEWPVCRECDGAMQFLAHLPLEAGVVSVFMCQNDPGLCDEWDATGGGNRAYLYDDHDLTPATVPTEGETLLGAVSAIRLELVDAADYGEAIDGWQGGDRDATRTILGQIGGEPFWLQNDETPHCPACAKLMGFAAQLEEGYDYRTAANFGGGGIGYVFTCAACREAAFLWQR